MTLAIGKQFLIYVGVGMVSLLLLACSAQMPVSEPSPSNTAATQESPAPVVIADTGQPVNPAGTDPALPLVSEPERETGTDAQFTLISSGAGANVLTGEQNNQPLAQSLMAQSKEDRDSVGIVATGTGRASAAPDLAILNLGVEALDATVNQARDSAASSMTAVIASLQENGVAEKDIQTGHFSIHPRYTGREITRCLESESDDTEITVSPSAAPQASSTGKMGASDEDCFQEYQSVITGYQVSNNLVVQVRDLSTIDEVIDGAVAAGGDHIRFNGVSFTLEDPSELTEKARSEAVSQLAAKAAHLAALGGVELGNLVYLSEAGGAAAPAPRAESARLLADASFGSSVSTPISAGEVTVEVSVYGQYLIAHPNSDHGHSN